MPLFGPNINKMSEKGDVSGLLKVTCDGTPGDRLKAIEALAEIGSADVLEQSLFNQSTSSMSSIWDKAILAVIGREKGQATEVFIKLLINEEVKEEFQEKILSALRKTGTFEADIWARTGATLLKNNRGSLALLCFEQAAESSPANGELLSSIGNTLLESKQFEAALKYFERFREVSPEDERAWLGRGLVLLNLKRYEEAKESCLKALGINPELIAAIHTLAGLYYATRSYDSLISFARETLKIGSSDIKIRVLLGLALLHSNELTAAETEMKQSVQIIHASEAAANDDLNMIHRSLAILYLMQGQWDEASQHIITAFEADPDNKITKELSESYHIINLLIDNNIDKTFLRHRVKLLTILIGLRLRPKDDDMPLTTQLYILKIITPVQVRQSLEKDDNPAELAGIMIDELTFLADALEKSGKLSSLVALI